MAAAVAAAAVAAAAVAAAAVAAAAVAAAAVAAAEAPTLAVKLLRLSNFCGSHSNFGLLGKV